MIAASTPTMIQPPVCVSVPLRKARHSRPAPWIRRLVSRPGIDAYCGRSLTESHDCGGLFQPGTAVEPCAATGGEFTFGAPTCAAGGSFTLASGVGAVFGG